MSFLQGSIDLFTGNQSSHMGNFQYVSHKGMRDNISMSGAELWAEIEAEELKTTNNNLFSAEEKLIRKVAAEIDIHFPLSSPVLEMGTGTPNAFKKKTLLIMMALRSTEYICVDESKDFLNTLSCDKALSAFEVNPILGNFFEGDACYFNNAERNALICMFGSTIGNIIAPMKNALPKKPLINHLSTISNAINKGGLLVSFDTDMNGDRVKSFYARQEAFQLNTFFRMDVELPLSGDFTPYGFAYEPVWQPQSGGLAHTAIVTQDMSFTLGDQEISLKKGQQLHMKNSFKYSHDFFEECAAEAGLSVIERWQEEDSSICMYLFDVPAKIEEATAPQITQERYGTNHNYYETDNAQIAI